VVDGHGVAGTPPLMPRKRTDSDTILGCSSAAKEAHFHTGVVAVRCAGRRQPLISPTLGAYFAEAGIALAKSAHVTRMKFCSFRNFLNSSLLTRSISFWRHCAPQSGWSNVAARSSPLS
jgi:hypothetical protein